MIGRRPPNSEPKTDASRAARARHRRQVELVERFSRRAVKRARIESLLLLPALIGVFVVYSFRDALFGPEWDTAVRTVTAVALVALGWQLARDVGHALGPPLFRRMDPGTAGTVGFVIRLTTLLAAVVIALRVAGLSPGTLAVGGAVTAVVVGLAAQQTIGNLIAGTVLISARSFRAGERVRFQGGGLAGTVEGVVSGQGLLYTTLANGDDVIMVPNSIVLNVAVVPLREPAGVDLRVRLRRGVPPVEVERLLGEAIQTPMRGRAEIQLEELTADEVTARITATPRYHADGAQLAGEVLEAVGPLTAAAQA